MSKTARFIIPVLFELAISDDDAAQAYVERVKSILLPALDRAAHDAATNSLTEVGVAILDQWSVHTLVDETGISRAINSFDALVEALQAIVDWAKFANQNPDEFNAHGVKNLQGPAFDKAEAALKLARAET